MKYTVFTDINLPRDRVVELMDNPDNMSKWMDGLQSFEHLSGDPGKPGAKTKMFFQMGKRKIEMIETILENNLPEEISMTFDADKVHNIIRNRFEQLPNGNTRYYTDQTFEFKGFMKLFGFFMPGAFKKQSQKYLEDFKAFAESESA